MYEAPGERAAGSERDMHLRLERVYRAGTAEQLQDAYRDWAQTYDHDLEHLGWDKPERVADVVVRHSPTSARVLDVGAGTGLVGASLARRGYADLSALDCSVEMLARARERRVYTELVCHDLHQPLPMPDDSYDVVVGVGVFTEGHVGSGCLRELGRVARGPIVFSLRDDLYEAMGFRDELKRLAWHLLERVRCTDGLGGRPWSVWVLDGSVSASGPDSEADC